MKSSIHFLILAFSCFACSDDDGKGLIEGERYQDPIFTATTVTDPIVYGSTNSVHTMVVYEPAGDTEQNRPLVILSPGGGFFQLQADVLNPLATYLAQAGYVVAMINYRLTSLDDRITVEDEFLASIKATHDLRAAVRYFRKSAEEGNGYRLNTANIFIGGHSAGAVISLAVGYINSLNEIEDSRVLEIFNQNGGLEGESGNPGFSSEAKGVINLAGTMLNVNWIKSTDPALISQHAQNDLNVSITTETLNFDNGWYVVHGSRLIHERAMEVGLVNMYREIESGVHSAPLSATECAGCYSG